MKKLEEKVSEGPNKDLSKKVGELEAEIQKLQYKNAQLQGTNKELKQDLEFSKREERTLKQKLIKRWQRPVVPLLSISGPF